MADGGGTGGECISSRRNKYFRVSFQTGVHSRCPHMQINLTSECLPSFAVVRSLPAREYTLIEGCYVEHRRATNVLLRYQQTTLYCADR